MTSMYLHRTSTPLSFPCIKQTMMRRSRCQRYSRTQRATPRGFVSLRLLRGRQNAMRFIAFRITHDFRYRWSVMRIVYTAGTHEGCSDDASLKIMEPDFTPIWGLEWYWPTFNWMKRQRGISEFHTNPGLWNETCLYRCETTSRYYLPLCPATGPENNRSDCSFVMACYFYSALKERKLDYSKLCILSWY